MGEAYPEVVERLHLPRTQTGLHDYARGDNIDLNHLMKELKLIRDWRWTSNVFP